MTTAAVGLSAVKQALQARQRRAESIAALRADPIAIIGMACRMPGGADSPEQLWSLLRDGRTTVGPVPPERWDAAAWHDPDGSAPGKSVTAKGSFLQHADGHGIDAFDAAYFGIAAREADRMDPQQRLLLEVAYEALDDAGIDQRSLAGSRSGVFIASYHDDYSQLQAAHPESIELRTLTGTLHSVLASRMSYLLDLRGPALAVDTACSSSLVAIHLACQSLRWGESDLAIAGGVSLMLTPGLMVMLSKVGFMAPDGRSKAFEAGADGFGRGEGCGVLVLRRLADAVVAGDRIWAVIRGSAVNQDGRSTLLTAPNGPAQEAMIREALAAAQLEPSRIGYVETHGTGTALGDPIEVEAIAAVLGRPEAAAGPCWLGALKANLGHMEAAAGVAGVMKAALALRHGAIAPQPSFGTLSPHIRLDGTRLAVPTVLVPWEPAANRPRCAAVSAFGVGGTNAHVILEEAPTVPVPPSKSRAGAVAQPAWLLPLSAKSASALATRARDFLALLDEDAMSVADLCHSAARRTPHAQRLAVVGRTRDELTQGLRRWLDAAQSVVDSHPGAGASASGVAFVFSGAAPSGFAMGNELLQAEPVFRERFMAVDALFASLAGWSLVEHMARSEADAGLQPATLPRAYLFALQVALAAQWRSWGVEPAAVVGEGSGEIAARHVGGSLELEAAVRLVLQADSDTDTARDRQRFNAVVQALAPGLSLLEIGAPSAQPKSGNARRDGGRESLLHAAAALFMAGVFDDPLRVEPATGRIVSLPAYPWQRQAHWLPRPTRAASEPASIHARPQAFAGEHPLIGRGMRIAGSDARVFLATPARARAWLDQHRVCGRLIVPGAAVMEALLAAANAVLERPASLLDFAIHGPIEVRDAGPGWQIVVRTVTGGAESIELEWFETSLGEDAAWRSVASARAQFAGPTAAAPALPTGQGSPLDSRSLYAIYAALEVEFGEHFRLLTDITRTPGGATAVVTLPAGVDATGFVIHPVLIDAAVQLCTVAAGAATASSIPTELYLPIGADRITIRAPADPDWQRKELRLQARLNGDAADGHVADVSICMADGTWIAVLERLRLARGERLGRDSLPLYDLEWECLPPAVPAAAAGPYLLLSADDSLARTLAAELPGPLLRVVPGPGYARPAEHVWQIDGANPAQLRRVLHEANWRGGTLIHAVSLGDSRGDPPVDPSAAIDGAGLALLLHLAQVTTAGRIAVVTRGAQAIADDEPLTALDPQAAPLWGLADVIRAEEPALHVRTIDLDPAEAAAATLVAELLAGDAAVAVAVRGGLRFRPVLKTTAVRARAPARGRHLVVQRPGTLDGLDWQAAVDTAPGAGEVRVKVHAAGVNFRDVLLTLGLYPGAAVPLGAECAGVVEAVGAGVELAVGQRVFGCATGCFAGAVTVPAAILAPVPERLSLAQAAALPVAFLTAMYGLERLARLRAGERVLVHAAAGGVGLAAVQLAQRSGAVVFATAGSAAKRAFLRAMGVSQVMDSRSVAFADEVLAATGGRGVDVVLNSLSGEFIPAGLRALAPGGRFLELGKRGVWSAEDVAASRPDVAYYLYDLGAAAAADAGLLPPLYAGLLEALADGSLRPLPVAEFPVTATAQALRTMAQARHVGKLVLRIADEIPRPMPHLRADGTYWITGGLSGLGLETAGWLVAQGARHLLLTGRSGPAPEAAARIAELESRGARIVVRTADAADRETMARVLREIDVAQPLRGVVHAAGTLHDGLLATQRWESAAEVLHGKLAGAWTLHALTQRLNLDFFVLYGAAGAVLGARGQGLYPAANAGLESLARYRRRLGLPALCVAWGLWREVGMAARTGAGGDAWSGRGLRTIDAALGFASMERLLAQNACYGIVLPIDWRRFLDTLPAGLDRSVFARVGRHSEPVPPSTAALDARSGAPDVRPGVQDLHALPPAERRAALLGLLREHTLAVIGLDPTTPVDPRQPLKDSGLDSLMAVELRNVLIQTGGVRLPATLLFDHPSLEALCAHLMSVWELTAADATATRAAGSAIEAAVCAMTDAEAEAQLLAELSTSGAR